MTASIITIYDRAGNILDDIEAQVEREWLLNEYGEATFTLAKTDPKCREDLLRFGNRILIQSNSGDASGASLPAWVGVIDPPRTWGDHDVTVTAYSAEYLFTWRRGNGARETTYNDTYGGIFRRLITLANQPEDLFIREGEIYEDDGAVERVMELHEMYDAILNMAEDSGQEWGVVPGFDATGRLVLLGEWYERRGVNSNFALEEGKNIQLGTSPLTEQDEIINDVMAYASTMVEWNSNLTSIKRDLDSIALYGLRQSAESVSDNGDSMALVHKAAAAELERRRQPTRMFDLTVMGAATLREMQLGNSYPIIQTSNGFYTGRSVGVSTRVRVIGMQWSDADQVLRLNCEEVRSG